MDRRTPQLKHREKEEQLIQEQIRSQTGREFASPEEMIRFDAAQTAVPPSVAQRLQESMGREPRPARSWWQRLMG